jgi:dolichyl-phosphate-mannose-protein mannosyltransferase
MLMDGSMAPTTPTGARRPRASRFVLAGICALALATHLWGIRRDLPYTREVDEVTVVEPAMKIASSGHLNPGWFGYPGSTFMYPLAGLYRLWNAIAYGGPLLGPDPALRSRYERDEGGFYLLGRLLAAAYAVLSLPLVYRLGCSTFDASVGLLAAWFSSLSTVAIDHAQMARTDSSAVFFGALSLWLCCQVYDRPGLGMQMAAGVSIGLAIASRYFMIALLPVLLAVDMALLRSVRSRPAHDPIWTGVVAGFASTLLAFVVSTPYLLLDRATALHDLQRQARQTHPGADGLSFAGNVAFYLTTAVPAVLPWPLALLAAAGVLLVLWERDPKQLLLVLMVVAFLDGISLSYLHWVRWVIPLLPVLAILAAASAVGAARGIIARFVESKASRRLATGVALCALSAAPVAALGRFSLQYVSPSTRVLAREWVIEHVPAGARIAEEWYTAPLAGTRFLVSQSFSVATGKTLADYEREGYRYLVVSSAIYLRYVTQPDRHPAEASFYRDLFRSGRLLQAFAPSATRRGPVISIYELAERQGSPG